MPFSSILIIQKEGKVTPELNYLRYGLGTDWKDMLSIYFIVN